MQNLFNSLNECRKSHTDKLSRWEAIEKYAPFLMLSGFLFISYVVCLNVFNYLTFFIGCGIGFLVFASYYSAIVLKNGSNFIFDILIVVAAILTPYQKLTIMIPNGFGGIILVVGFIALITKLNKNNQ